MKPIEITKKELSDRAFASLSMIDPSRIQIIRDTTPLPPKPKFKISTIYQLQQIMPDNIFKHMIIQAKMGDADWMNDLIEESLQMGQSNEDTRTLGQLWKSQHITKDHFEMDMLWNDLTIRMGSNLYYLPEYGNEGFNNQF